MRRNIYQKSRRKEQLARNHNWFRNATVLFSAAGRFTDVDELAQDAERICTANAQGESVEWSKATSDPERGEPRNRLSVNCVDRQG